MTMPMPTPPKNTFDEGADQSAERQKAALTELLAQQGQTGANLLKNRGEDAGALAAAAKAQFGDAGQPVSNLYQTFERDAQQRTNAHNEEQARIQAANQAYMDQVKGAIPLQRQDSENYTNALRMEYEDRQRQREADQLARDQANARANSQSAQLTALQKAQEAAGAKSTVAMDAWKATAWGQKTPQQAADVGAAGDPRTITDAAAAVGMDPEAAKRRWVIKQDSQFRAADDNIEQTMTDTLRDALKNNVPWNQVVAVSKQYADHMGMDFAANIQPFLAMWSPVWGVADQEWVTPAAKQTYGYTPK